MNFKKILAILALSFALVLTGCGNSDEAKDQNDTGSDKTTTENKTDNNSTEQPTEKEQVAGAPLQDGTYSLTELDFDKNGWKATFEITVSGGKITASKFDYVNADGALKSENDDYQKMMSEKVGVGPKDFIPALNDQLVKTQSAGSVEVVTGATHSSESFINYAQQLIQAAQKGDTKTIEIDAQAALKDGVYSLSEKNYSNNYRTVLSITVADGKITAVDYDYVDENGAKKSENEDYQKMMSEKTGVGPKDFIPQLANSLVETQDAGSVEVVTGATHSSHAFKMYAAQLINAAQKGDTTPIEVDNIVFAK